MGKYLEDRYLDSVLESYFQEAETDLMGYTLSNKKINNVSISIDENNDISEEESQDLIDKTYKLIKSKYNDIEKRLSENFGVDSKEIKPEEIRKELKLYQIVFSYHKMVAEYSPTGKDGVFIIYEFCFEPKTSKGKKYFDAVGTQYYVLKSNKGYELKYKSTYNI